MGTERENKIVNRNPLKKIKLLFVFIFMHYYKLQTATSNNDNTILGRVQYTEEYDYEDSERPISITRHCTMFTDTHI